MTFISPFILLTFIFAFITIIRTFTSKVFVDAMNVYRIILNRKVRNLKVWQKRHNLYKISVVKCKPVSVVAACPLVPTSRADMLATVLSLSGLWKAKSEHLVSSISGGFEGVDFVGRILTDCALSPDSTLLVLLWSIRSTGEGFNSFVHLSTLLPIKEL